MIPRSKPAALVTATLLAAAQGALAQHGHLNAGAVGHQQNDALVWANGAIFAASSGYIKDLTYATEGRYAGFYQGGITFTALASANGGAAPGSFLTAEIVSVLGPEGGHFGFWESPDLGGGDTPLFSIATGSTGLAHRFALSDASLGAGQPGQDAYGHLHGRRFTADVEGLYTVGFRVVDTSGNGPGGGAIHAPSEVLYINFAAVPEPSTFAVLGLGALGLGWHRLRRPKA